MPVFLRKCITEKFVTYAVPQEHLQLLHTTIFSSWNTTIHQFGKIEIAVRSNCMFLEHSNTGIASYNPINICMCATVLSCVGRYLLMGRSPPKKSYKMFEAVFLILFRSTCPLVLKWDFTYPFSMKILFLSETPCYPYYKNDKIHIQRLFRSKQTSFISWREKIARNYNAKCQNTPKLISASAAAAYYHRTFWRFW